MKLCIGTFDAAQRYYPYGLKSITLLLAPFPCFAAFLDID